LPKWYALILVIIIQLLLLFEFNLINMEHEYAHVSFACYFYWNQQKKKVLEMTKFNIEIIV